MRRKDCLFLSLILGAFIPAVHAQQLTSRLSIRMVVPPAGYLGLAGGSSSVGALSAPSLGNRALYIKAGQSGGEIAIPLMARSNTPYRVVAKLASNADDTVYLRADSVSLAAGGTLVTPEGRQARLFEGALSSRSPDLKIVDGPRISGGGNNSTAENAILIHVKAQLPENLPEAVLLFEMELVEN